MNHVNSNRCILSLNQVNPRWLANNKLEEKEKRVKKMKPDLTNYGIVNSVHMSITPRHHPEIDDVKEAIVEYTHEILYDEICTRWT